MKKLFFASLMIAIISSISSCKKCGYCQYPNGDRSLEVRQSNGVLSSTEDLVSTTGAYISAQANCAQSGARWVNE